MSFIDNPVISALGNELGLGPMFAAAAAGGAAPPTTPKPAVSKPNVPEYRNRPYIPRNEAPSGNGGVGSGGGNPVLPGAMSADTLQSPQVQSLLGQYGVSAPSTPPDPHLFIHNPEAFQRHPVLAGMLERGLGGLAYAHEGNNFLQSLIGGVKGIQEYDAASAQQVNNQLMAPISQATGIQQLQQRAQQMTDEHARTVSETGYQQGMLDHLRQTEETKQERIMAHQPYTNPKTGQTFTLDEDEDGNPKWSGDPNFVPDPELEFQHQRFKNAAQPLIDKYGSLDKVPADELESAYTKLVSGTSMAKKAAEIKIAGIHKDATIGAANVRGGGPGSSKMSDQQKRQYTDLDNQDKDIQRLIDSKGMDITKPFVDDDTGKLVVSGSARSDWVKKQQTKQQAIRTKKQALVGPTSSTPVIPEGADGVWDPVQKKTIYKGN